jgi:hypothetical protein
MLCANAAEQIVALVQILERNKLLEQISSDVIHMLSQAALVSLRSQKSYLTRPLTDGYSCPCSFMVSRAPIWTY